MPQLPRTDWSDHPELNVSRHWRAGGYFSSNPQLTTGLLAETPWQPGVVVMLEVYDDNGACWVLQQAPGGRWAFPGVRLHPGDLPAQVAIRAVTEKSQLLVEGLPLGWRGLECPGWPVGMEWLTASGDATGLDELSRENVLLFAYHARMRVPDLAHVEIREVGGLLSRPAQLSCRVAIQRYIAEGALCSACACLWQNYQ